jgi:hypothetical protein
MADEPFVVGITLLLISIFSYGDCPTFVRGPSFTSRLLAVSITSHHCRLPPAYFELSLVALATSPAR